MRGGVQETTTSAIRFVAFVITLVPFGALFLPWSTLKGSGETHTGVTSIALLASPIRDYLFTVDPVQAAIVTFGPAAIILLAIITGHHYYRRRSIPWAPPLTLAMVLATTYFTASLTQGTHEGPSVTAAAAVLLIVHQAAIRIQVAMRRSRPYSKAVGVLAIATGIAYRRRRR